MTKVVPFRRPDRQTQQAIREQAAAWLARLDATPGEAVTDELVDWLRQDRQHLLVMLEMATLWDQFTLLEELSDIFPLENYVYGQRKKSRRWAAYAVLAVLCLSLVTLLASITRDQHSSTLPRAYSTLVGEQESVSLPDGSQVMLNTNTAIEVNFGADERAIKLLRGEALFTVVRVPDRPFRVTAGTRVVEAVGTAFTVQHNERHNNLEVMVTEGEVLLQRQPHSHASSAALTTPLTLPLPLQLPKHLPSTRGNKTAAQTSMPLRDAKLSLRAGQLVTLNEDLDEVIQQELAWEEMQVRLSWQHGMLLFRNEPLSAVLEEVARYTTTTIEADVAVRDIKVDGYFRVGDIDGLLHAMQSNFRIDVQRLDRDTIYLSAQ